jgi:hypothetical protein
MSCAASAEITFDLFVLAFASEPTTAFLRAGLESQESSRFCRQKVDEPAEVFEAFALAFAV